MTRISVDSLTSLEADALKAAGKLSADAEFVDITPPEAPKMVDTKADKRKTAVAQLGSVAKAPTPQPQPQPAPEPVAAPAAPAPEAAPAAPTQRICQHCGWDLSAPHPAEPSKEDIANFLRCVMAGEVFEKRYSFFGGNVTALFRTRTGGEEEGIREVLRHLLRNQQIIGEAEAVHRIKKMHLAMGLASIRLGQSLIVHANMTDRLGAKLTDPQEFMAEVDLRIGKMPVPLLQVLYDAHAEFLGLVEVMTARAQDPGFWTGSASTP